MIPIKPYLITAVNNWILDNDLTPYILVDASVSGLSIPTDYVRNNRIVLSVNPSAILNLNIGNEEITFDATFNNLPMAVIIPIQAVLSIYSKEKGQGITFNPDDPINNMDDSSTKPQKVKHKLSIT